MLERMARHVRITDGMPQATDHLHADDMMAAALPQ